MAFWDSWGNQTQDDFLSQLSEEEKFAQEFLGTYKTNRMAAAEEAMRRQRLAIEQQANLAGFTGTGVPGQQISRAASDIMGGAQGDISSLGTQVDMLSEQNVQARATYEEELKKARRNRLLNLGLGVGATALSFIPGFAPFTGPAAAGFLGKAAMQNPSETAYSAGLQYLQGRPDLMQTLSPYGNYGYGGGTPAYPQDWDPLYGGGYGGEPVNWPSTG